MKIMFFGGMMDEPGFADIEFVIRWHREFDMNTFQDCAAKTIWNLMMAGF